MGVVLELETIEKRFGARRVLREVSLSVRGGEVLAITGPNGTGKSTLLKIIAGLLRPTKGVVRLDGSVEAALRRQKVGYVAPDLLLYPELTGRENLAFFARVRGMSPDLDAALKRVGLTGRGDDPMSIYSSGMRQRLRIALATLFDAPLLLLDEPGLALDASGVAMMEALIQERRQAGAAIVLATNDSREASWGDRCFDVAL